MNAHFSADSIDRSIADDVASFERGLEEAGQRLELYRLRQLEIEKAEQQKAEREQASRDERRLRFTAQRRDQARYELPFLSTSVAAIIDRAVERVLRFGQSGLVIGAPGVGKSRALGEIVRRGQDGEGPDAALIEVSGISGNSTKAILDDVSARVGVEPATSIADTERRLHRQVDYSPILLFDEAQNLTLKPARILLGIAEATGIPMLFCGNNEVLKLVSTKQADIQQIARRLPIREEIDCILERDADLIADHFGVSEPKTRRLCRDLGILFHADGIARVLTEARDIVGTDAPIGAEAIQDALDVLPQFRRALAQAAGHAALPARRSSLKPLVGRRN